MKATGIVRRIDDLGRVVIPKEIRRTMRIREGDPLEIYTDKDGGVIFKKYSLMGGLGDFAGQMCETLNKTTGEIAVITDRDACIAVAGLARRELTDKRISSELEQIMEGRQIYQYQAGDKAVPVSDDGSKYLVACAAPILSEGDVLGCVLFVGTEGELASSETDYKLAQPASWAGTWNPDSNDDRGHPCSDAPYHSKKAAYRRPLPLAGASCAYSPNRPGSCRRRRGRPSPACAPAPARRWRYPWRRPGRACQAASRSPPPPCPSCPRCGP